VGLGAGAKRIGFVSGFLTVGAGQGRFKTGTVGLGAGTEGIGVSIHVYSEHSSSILKEA